MDKILRNTNIWDLHIHTPLGTPTKKNYGNASTEEFIDTIIDIYNKSNNKIGMISFTDHNKINADAYELFKIKSDIAIIPGIEVDVYLSEKDKDSKHIIFYFDEEELENIRELKTLVEDYIESNEKVIFEDFIMYLVVKRKHFAVSPHAFKQGKRGIDNDWFDEERASRGANEFTGLIFPFWEAAGKTDICKAIEFLNEQYNDEYNNQSVIAFSDSADYKKLQNYINNPHQYFRCLNSFKGLLLAGSDPDRIIYENENRPLCNPSVIITQLRLLLCVLKWCPTVSLESVTDILLRNFTAFDFVSQDGVVTGKYHVIIGNPPYVEDSKCGLKLQTRYGNIYANVLIHSSNLLEKNGAMGFVIPLSYISTPRMNRLRSDLFITLPEQFVLNYADRPDCLFDSVHQKLCVLIAKNRKASKKVFTSKYQYWYKDERNQLFSNIQVIKNNISMDKIIPKLGNRIDLEIFSKIINCNRNVSVYEVSREGTEVVCLNRRETFWMKAYRTTVDDPEYKVFKFHSESEADYCYCLINSSLFWWYWIAVSDCWHVSKDLNGFMAPFLFDHKRASELARSLQEKLEETKVYVGTKQTEYEYKHKKCLNVISEIDEFVNELFELTKEESAYIKEYALKYRTGGGVNDGCY